MTVRESVPEELQLVAGPSWRGRLFWLVALALFTGGLVFATYATFVSGGEEARRDFETHVVERKTIRSTVAASGVGVAPRTSDVSFARPGRVKAVEVELGDDVSAGDLLATLDEPEMGNAVAAAESNLRTAQIRLSQLLKGASHTELSAAQQAVASAEATYDKAVADVQKLRDGATSVEITSAQQAVASAEATLAEAQARLDTLRSEPSQAAIAAAESTVMTARNALNSARTAAENADSNVASAEGSFQEARAEYCAWPDALASICPSSGLYAPPLSDPHREALQDQLSNTSIQDNLEFIVDQSALLGANAAYNIAVSSRDNALDNIERLEKDLQAAELKLKEVKEGPSAASIAAAGTAVTSAEQLVASAQSKLDDLLAGTSVSDIATAESQVRAAEAALVSAEARLADLLDGADIDDVLLAQENEEAARISLLKAAIERDKSELRAPFDGVVAAVNIRPGEFTTSAAPAFTVIDPDGLQLELTIGEVDLPQIRKGFPGGIIFDAIQGRPYFFVIESVGLAPQVQQGVVTYIARAGLMVPDDAPRPAPGMNGAALIQLEQRDDVVAVPARALRRRGEDQILELQLPDGAVEERVIQTGMSDGQNVEVVSGLEVGEVVLIPRLAGGDTGGGQQQLPAGIR
jgi:HlyD family secretion protein